MREDPLKKLVCLTPSISLSNILRKYMMLNGSTTYFLQELSSADVHVEVLRQVIDFKSSRKRVLKRTSRLYLGSIDNILVVAKSSIFLESFSEHQQKKLIETSEGIGKILDPRNDGLIKKQDISTSYIEAPSTIKTKDTGAICRHFILYYHDNPCAEIKEIVNSESLGRVTWK